MKKLRFRPETRLVLLMSAIILLYGAFMRWYFWLWQQGTANQLSAFWQPKFWTMSLLGRGIGYIALFGIPLLLCILYAGRKVRFRYVALLASLFAFFVFSGPVFLRNYLVSVWLRILHARTGVSAMSFWEQLTFHLGREIKLLNGRYYVPEALIEAALILVAGLLLAFLITRSRPGFAQKRIVQVAAWIGLVLFAALAVLCFTGTLGQWIGAKDSGLPEEVQKTGWENQMEHLLKGDSPLLGFGRGDRLAIVFFGWTMAGACALYCGGRLDRKQLLRFAGAMLLTVGALALIVPLGESGRVGFYEWVSYFFRTPNVIPQRSVVSLALPLIVGMMPYSACFGALYGMSELFCRVAKESPSGANTGSRSTCE